MLALAEMPELLSEFSSRPASVVTSPLGTKIVAKEAGEPKEPESAQARIGKLAKQIRQIETANQTEAVEAISAGCDALNRVLPHGGYLPGTIVEWLRQTSGSGATYLSLTTAREAMRDGKSLVIVDWQQRVYPLALRSLGIDLQRVIFVRPRDREEGLWAMDQALRCSAVGAVWGELTELDDRVARRLQLAAEQGQTLGLLVREKRVQGQPSWAEVQWLVQGLGKCALNSTSDAIGSSDGAATAPGIIAHGVTAKWQTLTAFSNTAPSRVARRVELNLLRCRGGRTGAKVQLEIDIHHGQIDEVKSHGASSALYLASQLAMPASARREKGSRYATARVASA